MDELEDFLKKNQIEIAVLTIPKTKALEVANTLVNNGVRAIWNFAHIDLNLPEDVIVENVHLSESCLLYTSQLFSVWYRRENRKYPA